MAYIEDGEIITDVVLPIPKHYLLNNQTIMNVDIKNNYEVVDGEKVTNLSLKDLLSKTDYTILYFYPRDNTPGCSVEAVDFTSFADEFSKLGFKIIGVSKDSTDSHKKFICNKNISFPLISDPELILHKELGAYGEKNNYGKIVQGVIRSTFILDKEGEVITEYRNIRAKGHAERVLKEIKKVK